MVLEQGRDLLAKAERLADAVRPSADQTDSANGRNSLMVKGTEWSAPELVDLHYAMIGGGSEEAGTDARERRLL